MTHFFYTIIKRSTISVMDRDMDFASMSLIKYDVF